MTSITSISQQRRIRVQKGGCEKCNSTGWYRYDHNHMARCEACCEHDKGWFRHESGLCCKAGCGIMKKEWNLLRVQQKTQRLKCGTDTSPLGGLRGVGYNDYCTSTQR